MMTSSDQKIFEGMEEDQIITHQILKQDKRKLVNPFQLGSLPARLEILSHILISHINVRKNTKEMGAQNILDYSRFFENVHFDKDKRSLSSSLLMQVHVRNIEIIFHKEVAKKEYINYFCSFNTLRKLLAMMSLLELYDGR